MKEKFIKLNSILLLFLAGILLYSCSYDDDNIESSNLDGKYQITRKKLTNLFEEKKFSTSYAKLPKKKLKKVDINGRTVMEDQYGFTITSQYANEVVGDSTTSYTLAIKRDNTVQSYDQENLIISVNNYTAEIKAFILKYKSNVLLTTLSHFTGEKELTPIIYNGNSTNSTTGKMVYECVTFVFPCINHVAGESGCWGPTYQTICSSYDDGLDGGGGDSSGSTGSGDNGGGGSVAPGNTTPGTTTQPTENHNEPIVTVPELSDEPQDQTQKPNPCDLINNKTQKASYINNFNNLNKSGNFTFPEEQGFVEKNVNGVKQYQYLTASGGNALNIPSGSFNFTHVHNNKPLINSYDETYDSAIKMLSPEDLLALIKTCSVSHTNQGLSASGAFGVMISNEGIFSISLVETLSSAEKAYCNLMWDNFRAYYDKESLRLLNDTTLSVNQRKEELQKMFLNGLKTLGLENKIGFFEGAVTTENGIKKLNWTRKTLSSNQLTPSPC